MNSETGHNRSNSILGKRFVGEAWMNAEKYIVMKLWASHDLKPMNLTVQYRPGETGYDDIIAHLGGLGHGELKLVPRWC